MLRTTFKFTFKLYDTSTASPVALCRSRGVRPTNTARKVGNTRLPFKLTTRVELKQLVGSCREVKSTKLSVETRRLQAVPLITPLPCSDSVFMRWSSISFVSSRMKKSFELDATFSPLPLQTVRHASSMLHVKV